MRAYYIDRPLTPDEILIVEQSMACEIEQVQIPYVVPASDSDRNFADDIIAGTASLAPVLRKAGIEADAGKQVALVVPKDQELNLTKEYESILT